MLSERELAFIAIHKDSYPRVYRFVRRRVESAELAEELAAGLGTLGHLSCLRRLWVEPFADESMVTLQQIEASLAAADLTAGHAWLQPVDRDFPDLPELRLDASGALHLRQGGC